MSQAVTSGDPKRFGSLATVLTVTLCGLVLGVAFDAAVWLWAFGEAISGEARVAVPLIVSTSTEQGDVVAQTDIGILVVPLILALLGACFGLVIAHHRRRRPETTASA